ncbi:hypothetical protein H4W31_000194 [Plantactinospora soyae]|uniref:Uncharacterized protein n=1 Tax=Plantactinospora soyae TaxID=1544732 RepID=A0A927M0P7_9ACTN|nr:hypothetical protein [Plantactinospora soyae]
MLVSTDDARYGADHVLEDFTQDLDVGYSFGPPYGNRLVTWDDLDELDVGQRELRQVAVDNLYRLLPRLRIDGQPPAPMLSFGGLESSVLLAAEVWEDLQRSVPGELVVGVPARDVVIVTGTESRPGMEKVRRAVDRIFFAGDQNLLSPDLLVWRQGAWSAYRRTTPEPEPPQDRWAGPGRDPEQWNEPEEPPRSRYDDPEVDPEPEQERWATGGRTPGPRPSGPPMAGPRASGSRTSGSRASGPPMAGPRTARERDPEPEPERERWTGPATPREPEPERERWTGPATAREPGGARWARPEVVPPEPEPEPEPERSPYRLPRQRSGDGGTTDWPERTPARRSKRRRPRPNGSAR